MYEFMMGCFYVLVGMLCLFASAIVTLFTVFFAGKIREMIREQKE